MIYAYLANFEAIVHGVFERAHLNLADEALVFNRLLYHIGQELPKLG